MVIDLKKGGEDFLKKKIHMGASGLPGEGGLANSSQAARKFYSGHTGKGGLIPGLET